MGKIIFFYEGYFKTFFVTDPFSVKDQQMDLKRKKLYSPSYNLLFDIIAIPSEAFFIQIDEFVDTCGMPCRVNLFNGLPLRSSSVTININ